MKRLICCLTLLLAASLLVPFNAAAAQSGSGGSGPADPPAVIGEPLALPGDLGIVQPMFTGCARVDVASINEAYEQRVVELVNQHRAEPDHNLPPLKRNTDLDYAARFHADDMATEDYFNHNSFDRDGNGNLVQVCEPQVRIGNFYKNWNALAENIAAGQTSPESVMTSWINSSGHHKNITSDSVWEIGVGFYTTDTSYYHRYWVQDFGRRPYSTTGYFPVVINREAASTTSRQVSLYIYGEGTWNEMRLRNDNEAWTSWQTFQKDLSWELPCTSGLHTVSVEMRQTGQTTAGTASADSISLQSDAGPVSIGSLPDSVFFLYGKNTDEFSLPAYPLKPTNSASSQAATWTVSKTGFESNWLNLSASSGTLPNDAFTITPVSSALPTSLGDHSGTLTINATSTNPQCPVTASYTTTVHVLVAADLLRDFLPLINK